MADQRPILPLRSGIGRVNPINVGGPGSAEEAFRNRQGLLQGILGSFNVSPAIDQQRQDQNISNLQALRSSLLGTQSLTRGPESQVDIGVQEVAPKRGLGEILLSAIKPKQGFGNLPQNLSVVPTLSNLPDVSPTYEKVPGDDTFTKINRREDFPGRPSGLGIPDSMTVDPTNEIVPGDEQLAGGIPLTSVTEDIKSIYENVDPASESVPGDEQLSGGIKVDDNTPEEQAFAGGMKAYLDALGKDVKIGSIDDYKKEFADATGIDVSGKVDKSQALMAFGLALMQNKAGKGFNVGKLLSEVGAAGEKAMPSLADARKEAKAGQLAAGKFALQERANDISRGVARQQKIADRIAELSDKAYDRDTQLLVERLKAQADLEKTKLKELAANQRESTKSLAAAGELGSLTKINLGGDDPQSKFEIQVQQVGKTGAFQFLDAKGEMDRVNGMIKSADSQIATVNKMFDIAEAGDVSGAEGTYNYISSKLKGVGIELPGAEPQKIEEYNAAMSKLLTQARRLLTGGEAGNAISDRDVAIMEQGMGLERNSAGAILFSSSNQAMEYVQNLKELFNRKKDELVTVKDRLYKLGLRNGHYIDYIEPESGELISENKNFADDFVGYESEIVNGRIRYTLKDK